MSEQAYTDADFANPAAYCDVVMKGGITSGAVYPLALTELAKHYRFSNIGGTSAGGIAAGAAAAAEYGRHVPGKGFMRLAQLPAETGELLFSLFQPTATVAPIFNMLAAWLGAKSTVLKVLGVIWAAIWGFRWPVLIGAAIAAVIAYLLDRFAHVGGLAFGVLLTLLGLVVGLLCGLLRAATTHLTANNYGLCNGIHQPGFKGPGFTDWLADLIDDAAGRDPRRDDPLTFGDLEHPDRDRQPIKLRMMTTNLMMSRPHTLPFEDETFKFKREDFAKLFSERVMAYLLRNCRRFAPEAGEPGEFYYFPSKEKLPVVVAVRMSLSFPILISAVPLYARDHTLRGDAGKALQLCLFSDGGLSSNFPIHFFDRMLPNTPTFGISLGAYDRDRDPHAKPPGPDGKDKNDASENRVWMPSPHETRGGSLLPITPFTGTGAFVYRLVNAAKDWQDNLQSVLAGSRDRIVTIYLKPDEGGLNITMPASLVGALGQYGAYAGHLMLDEFKFDEHRWRRFLVAMDRFNETTKELIEAYDGRPPGPHSFANFLKQYPPAVESYKDVLPHLPQLLSRVEDLIALSRKWQKESKIPEATLPHPTTDLRIVPRI